MGFISSLVHHLLHSLFLDLPSSAAVQHIQKKQSSHTAALPYCTPLLWHTKVTVHSSANTCPSVLCQLTVFCMYIILIEAFKRFNNLSLIVDKNIYVNTTQWNLSLQHLLKSIYCLDWQLQLNSWHPRGLSTCSSCLQKDIQDYPRRHQKYLSTVAHAN